MATCPTCGLAQRPDLLAAIPELRDKRLACWCFPLRCHGDVLAETSLRLLPERVSGQELTGVH